jgi:predicted permease
LFIFEKASLIFSKYKNNMEQQLFSAMPWLLPVIMIAVIWEGVWKLIALWKSARNDHLAWFICIAIFNTIGILPIIYLLIYRKKAQPVSEG